MLRHEPERVSRPKEFSQPKPDYNLDNARNNPSENRNYEPRERNMQPRSYSQEVSTSSRNPSQNESGYMSNYGNRLMRPMPGKDQDRVFENQQKPYNIISFYPNDSAIHRKYPKLTL